MKIQMEHKKYRLVKIPLSNTRKYKELVEFKEKCGNIINNKDWIDKLLNIKK